MTLESAKRPYLYFNDGKPAHQRAVMVTDILHEDSSLTLDEAIDLAFCTQVLGAEKWQERIARAWQRASDAAKTADAKAVAGSIAQWNRLRGPRLERALCYYAFKMALPDKKGEAVEVPADLTDEQIVTALTQATNWLRSKAGSVTARYGDVFRVAPRTASRASPSAVAR